MDLSWLLVKWLVVTLQRSRSKEAAATVRANMAVGGFRYVGILIRGQGKMRINFFFA